MSVDLNGILKYLYEERDRIEEAIQVFERLATTRGSRRGRPPKWLKEAEQARKRDHPRKEETRV